jgi:4-amino-4-deoxy-L-arabinose transferase-like glycosyltransferase
MNRSAQQLTADPRTRTALIAAIAAFPALKFVYVAFSRLRYPWDLEWLEGQCMEMAHRFAQGLPLYTPPSVHHVALPYFPLYFVVTGLIYRAAGVSYWAGRLVSTLATLATGGIVFWVVRRTVRQLAPAMIAAGLWFAAYGFSGFFYDLNRVDSLAMFFLAAAYAAAFARAGVGAGLTAGALLAASALTKQNHVLFVGPLLFVQLVRGDRRGAVAGAATFVALFGAAAWLWNRESGGWFWTMTMDFVTFAPSWVRVVGFVPLYFLHFVLPCVMLLSCVVGLTGQRKWRELFGDPWLVFWAASAAISQVMFLGHGAFSNAGMPAALGTALATGMRWPEFVARLERRFARGRAAAPRWVLPALAALTIFAAYSPVASQIPSPTQWLAAERLHALVRSQPASVLIPEFILPEANVAAFHEMSYFDLRVRPYGKWRGPWLRQVRNELADLRPTMLLASDFVLKTHQYYTVLRGMIPTRLPDDLCVQTVTGRIVKLTQMYRPDAAVAAEPAPPASEDTEGVE